MNLKAFIPILALSLTACTGCANGANFSRLISPEPKTQVDISGVLHLMGRFYGGSACPVTPNTALTSAHVAQAGGAEGEKRTLGYMYSTDLGQEGLVTPDIVDEYADIASLHPLPGTTFGRYYTISHVAPDIGDEVTIVGYDWRDAKRGYGTRVWKAKVLRIVAMTLVLDNAGEPGSSGSCVFQDKTGLVVGINEGWREMDSGARLGQAVGVWRLPF